MVRRRPWAGGTPSRPAGTHVCQPGGRRQRGRGACPGSQHLGGSPVLSKRGLVSSPAEVGSAGEDGRSTRPWCSGEPAAGFLNSARKDVERALSHSCHRGRRCPPRARKLGRRFSDSPGAPARPTPACFDVVLSVKLAASGWCDGPRRSRSPSANGQEKVRRGVEVFQNANGVDPQRIRVVGRPGLGSHHSGGEERNGGSFP